MSIIPALFIIFIIMYIVLERIKNDKSARRIDSHNIIFIEIDKKITEFDDFVFYLHNHFNIENFIHSLHRIMMNNSIYINNVSLLHNELVPFSGKIFNHIFTNETISRLFEKNETVLVELNIMMKVIHFEIKLKYI